MGRETRHVPAITSIPSRGDRRAFPTVLAALILTALPPGASEAGSWRITPRVTVNEVYSDNIGLAAPGLEKSDFVTDVSPGISIQGKGGRLKANVHYNLQKLFYARDSDRNGMSHQLQGDARAELVRQQVFLDLRSTISQQNTSNLARSGIDNISTTGNQTNVVTYSVAPVFRHHFGSMADAEVRYTVNSVKSGGSGTAADSNGRRQEARLVSGSEFARLPWSLSYRDEVVDNATGTTSKFKRVEGEARYHFTRKYGLVASGGIDRNDFASSQPQNDGKFWRLGLTWNPSPRTSVETGYGQRFFGSNLFLDLRHRTRRTVWTARYNEDTSTTRQLLLEQQLVALVDPFGNPIIDPGTGNPILIPIDVETLTDEVIVRRRFEGSMAFRGRRTDLVARAFNERRSFQLSGDEEEIIGGSLTASRRLSRLTSVNLSGRWQKTEARGGARDDTLWETSVGLSRRLSKDVALAADARHMESDSTGGGNNFTENRVSVRLNVNF